MKTRFVSLIFISIVSFTTGCRSAGPTAPPQMTVTLLPPNPTVRPVAPDMLDALSPLEVIAQLDYEPTFSRPEEMFAYGRVPPFTLFADGQLVYVEEGQAEFKGTAMLVQLSAEEATGMINELWAMGFSNLASQTGDCRDLGNGTRECVADASYTLLRLLEPDGTVREIKIYYNFSDDPDILEAIRSRLSDYTHQEAKPYQPQSASLFLRRLDHMPGVQVHPWPVRPAWLDAIRSDPWQELPLRLAGDDLAKFLEAVPSNIGDFFFELEGDYFAAYLVPWLPGADYPEVVAPDLAQFEATPLPEPTQIPASTSPAAVNKPEQELDSRELTSVLEWLAYAIYSSQPVLVADMMGEQGLMFAPPSVGVNLPGYNNREEMLSEIEKALQDAEPVCLGYDPLFGRAPDKAIMVFQGLNFDWPAVGLAANPEDAAAFEFFRYEQGWVLVLVVPLSVDWELPSISNQLQSCLTG